VNTSVVYRRSRQAESNPAVYAIRIPGHEVIGKVAALGEGVSGWTTGQGGGVRILEWPLFPLPVLPKA
jgi:D-arabinose 1-dehydrogenase-like Zn-dependent alcohol dehydrogenase